MSLNMFVHISAMLIQWNVALQGYYHYHCTESPKQSWSFVSVLWKVDKTFWTFSTFLGGRVEEDLSSLWTEWIQNFLNLWESNSYSFMNKGLGSACTGRVRSPCILSELMKLEIHMQGLIALPVNVIYFEYMLSM